METTDNASRLNTDVGMPPKMEFLRRFIYDSWNDRLKEVVRHTTSTLMTPLMSPRERQYRVLSPVAKLDYHGNAEQAYGYKMPPVDVSAVFIAQAQQQTVPGTAPANAFPYKLAAVGRVNGRDIFNRAGQPGEIVSRKVMMVP